MAIDWNDLVLGPCIAVFGASYLYQSGQSSFSITGIFDESYTPLSPLGGGSLPGTESFTLGSVGSITTGIPVLGVQLSQFPTPPAQGDNVTIDNRVWVVKEVQPDSKGGAKLLLNLANSTRF